LRASDQVPGAVSVDDWVSGMLAKPWRNNRNQPMQGKQVSIKFVQNVLVLLGQCFDTAVKERPALQVNPAPDIGLPKQDRREMHVLEDRADYGRLRRGMNVHFVPLLDFLVGTGVRWGEAAELLTRRLHLDSPHPRVDVRVVLKWVGRKWKLGRPKTP
jgi:integrase